MSRHTPGPWRLSERPQAGYGVVAEKPKVSGGTDAICTCRPAYRTDKSHDEAEANARLIAAAPDLLETLKIARKCLRNCHYVGPEREMIDAAIAKAEGNP